MNIIFMGTPEFALPTLHKLYNSNHNIQLIVTQPDRPKGRGRESTPPPVKQFALEKKIPLLQPKSCKNLEVIKTLEELNSDVFVVVAFGQILDNNLLALPHHFCINLHSSLLPKYRGAAPINWAIINGENETGVTTMKMDAGLDTGDILLSRKVQISDEDDAQSLHDTLAHKGSSLILETLSQLHSGSLKKIRQNPSLSSYAPKLKKEDGLIQWNQPAFKIHNLVRGLTPWPGAFSFCDSKRFKICKTEIKDCDSIDLPGLVLRISGNGIEVGTQNKRIIITELQPEGKKRMHVKSFLAGHSLSIGSTFTE
ncbi:MAG: methionyl-tRNA formyltransferase [Nitrospina sp.]|nr:methionyl-tRNA formyltransferase [Nitrospina sp.]